MTCLREQLGIRYCFPISAQNIQNVNGAGQGTQERQNKSFRIPTTGKGYYVILTNRRMSAAVQMLWVSGEGMAPSALFNGTDGAPHVATLWF
jgi:hypothetical protein